MNDALFDVKDRVVLLTGACGLIGMALAESLHARGARLILVDIPAADPDRMAARFEGALGHVCDVAKADQVAELVTHACQVFGRIDVLINNHQYKPKGFLEAQAETFPEELWDAILDVNLKGTFLTCR